MGLYSQNNAFSREMIIYENIDAILNFSKIFMRGGGGEVGPFLCVSNFGDPLDFEGKSSFSRI